MGIDRRSLGQAIAGAAVLAAAPGLGMAGSLPTDDRVLGNARARVTVIEYASITCPHCARWHAEVWPSFRARYVDTGKVRFVLRELPTEPAAVAAAGFMVARCAPAAKYYDVVDALFEGQEAWLQSQDLRGWLTTAGARGGLTPAQVEACALSREGVAALNARVNRNLTIDTQVSSTPTFLINGAMLVGEQSLEALDAAIQPLLRGRR
ncbi:MAG: DsbA family protein [Caulobacteraceae bacterium]|nr:DsbA family protein [Caulobacteraceae bacterium]